MQSLSTKLWILSNRKKRFSNHGTKLGVLLSVLGPSPRLPPPSAPAPRPSPGASFPVLPTVPTDLPSLPDSVPGVNSAGGEDVDFDDLTRRFEDLKRKK